ncbi:MAG: right-handed parallel beta-helix repeat-containing protein, partial [Planctomycetota bacterium]
MTLSGCVSANASLEAFWVGGSGCVLSRCVTPGASSSGFRLTGSGNTLSGCVADGCGNHAVRLQSNGNLVTGCRIGLVSPILGAGIQLEGASGNVVSSCTIADADGSGIEVGPYGDARCNRLERNRVSGSAYGIYLSNAYDASDNWLEANTVTGNTSGGIRVDSDDNVIVRNKASA